MMIYAPAMLREALEVALEDLPSRQGASKPCGPEQRDRSSLKRQPKSDDGPEWSGDHFDGNPREQDRVVDALVHIPPENRRIWREVTVALCDWFMGDARGRELAEAWSGGGTFGGVAFAGCPEKFDRAAQDLLWREVHWVWGVLRCHDLPSRKNRRELEHQSRALGPWPRTAAASGAAGGGPRSASGGTKDAAAANQSGALRLALPSAARHQAARSARCGFCYRGVHQQVQRDRIFRL